MPINDISHYQWVNHITVNRSVYQITSHNFEPLS
jgi:hypothetical protein